MFSRFVDGSCVVLRGNLPVVIVDDADNMVIDLRDSG